MKIKGLIRAFLSLVGVSVALAAALLSVQPAAAVTQTTPVVTATSSSTTAGAVNLSWTGTATPAELSGYDVRYSTSSTMGGSTTIGFATGAGSNTSYTVTGLTAGTTYFFDVRAKSTLGTGSDSARSTAVSAVAATTLATPTTVTVTASGAGGQPAIGISWAPSTNAPTGQKYSVKVFSNAGLNTQVGSTLTAQTSPLVFNIGLTSGSSYWVTVTAEGSTGFVASAASAAGTGVAGTSLATPAAPTVVSGATVGTLVVTFTANPLATSTTVRVYSDAGLTLLVGSAFTSSVSPLTVSGLAAGSTFYVTVTSVANGITLFDSPASPAASARTKSALSLTVDAKSLSYGSISPAAGYFTYSITGWLNGESALTAAGFVAPTCSAAGYAQGNNAATTSQISCTGSSANDYVITQVGTALLTVSKALLTVTPGAQTVTYGQIAPATGFYTFGVTGWVLSQSSAIAAGYVAPTCASSYAALATYGAGSKLGAITCSGGAANNYSFDVTASANLQVNKAVLTVTPNAQTLTYGQSVPASTFYTFAYSGFVNSESSASVTFTSGLTAPACTSAFDGSKNWGVGTYANAITCSGGVSSNYTFTTTAKSALTVTKATITVFGCARISPTSCSPSSPNQVLNVTYGDVATVTYQNSVQGFLTGDTFAINPSTGFPYIQSCTSAYSKLAHAGTIQVTCTTPDAGANYNVVVSAGTIVVAKKTLVVTAQAQSISYGQPATGLTATISATLNGDVLTAPPVCTSIYVAGNSVGTYPISCTISAQTDYILDGSGPQGSLTVTAANLVITANGLTAQYGDVAPTYTFSAPARFANDAWIVAPVCSAPTYSQGANLGTYVINCSSAQVSNSTNYLISYQQGNLVVGPKTITVTAKALSLVYGSTAPASYEFVATGFYNGQTWLTSPDATPSCSASYSTSTHVGTYPIGCTGGDAGTNYLVQRVSNFLQVTARPVLVVANSVTTTYGTLASFGFSTSSVVGQSESGLLAADSFTYNPGCSVSLYNSRTPAGSYTINCSGAGNSDYTVSYQAGTLQVNQRTIVITAKNESVTYGDTVPTYSYDTDSLLSGDSIGTVVCGSSYTVFTSVSASPLPLTCSGATNPNYAISYAPGRTVTIAKQPVTVSFNTSIFYGDAPPTYQPNISGLRNGDLLTPAPSCSSSYQQFSPVASYLVTCVGGALSQNYSLEFVAGQVQVNKRAITVQATLPTIGAAKKITYGDRAPDYSFAIISGSFVNGESFESLSQVPVCGSNYQVKSDVRSYTVSCSIGTLTNYEVTALSDSFSVQRQSLTIQPLSAEMTYGDLLPNFTPSVTGFIDGDGFSTAPICVLDFTTRPNAGTHIINCEKNSLVVRGQLSNYVITFNTATLTVKKKPITATAATITTVVFGDNVPAVSYSTSGLERDPATTIPDAITGNTLCTTSYFKGAAASNVAYETHCVFAVQANYEVTALPGGITVNKKNITVRAPNPSLVYGSDVAPYVPTLEGLVSGFPVSAQPVCTSTYAKGSPVSNVRTDYPITCKDAEGANYSFGYVIGGAIVTQRQLEIEASSRSIAYGTELPKLGYVYFGLINTDVLTTEPICVASNYTVRSTVGSYAIRCSGAVQSNYIISYTAGNLQVTKRSLIVRASDLTISVGAVPPVYQASVSGLVNSDSFDVQPVCSSTYNQSSARGDYPITCTGGAQSNYSITSYQSATLSVRYSNSTLQSLAIGGQDALGGRILYVPFGTSELPVSFVTVPGTFQSVLTSGEDNLATGVNLITVTVTADDSSQTIYSVTVIVDNPALNAVPVEVRPGESVVTIDGVPQAVSIISSNSNGSVSLSGPGWGVSLIVTGANGIVQPLDSSNLLAAPGDRISLSLRGYRAGSSVNVYVMSEPILLGTFVVDSFGNVLANVDLPSDLLVGSHSLQINGVSSDASIRSASVSLGLRPLVSIQKTMPFKVTSSKLSESVSKAIAAMAKAAKKGRGILVKVDAILQGKSSASDTKLAKTRSAALAAIISALKKTGIKAIFVPRSTVGVQTGAKSLKVVVSMTFKA